MARRRSLPLLTPDILALQYAGQAYNLAGRAFAGRMCRPGFLPLRLLDEG